MDENEFETEEEKKEECFNIQPTVPLSSPQNLNKEIGRRFGHEGSFEILGLDQSKNKLWDSRKESFTKHSLIFGGAKSSLSQSITNKEFKKIQQEILVAKEKIKLKKEMSENVDGFRFQGQQNHIIEEEDGEENSAIKKYSRLGIPERLSVKSINRSAMKQLEEASQILEEASLYNQMRQPQGQIVKNDQFKIQLNGAIKEEKGINTSSFVKEESSFLSKRSDMDEIQVTPEFTKPGLNRRLTFVIKQALGTDQPYPKGWILPNSKFYEVWSYILMIIAQTWIFMFIPYRLSFEDRRLVKRSSVYCDSAADLLFLIDAIFTLFLLPLQKQTDFEFEFNRRKVFCTQIKSLVLLDLVGCLPIAYFKHTSEYHEDYSDLKYFVTLNFAYVPRMYALLLSVKLLRIRRFQSVFFRFLRKVLGIRLYIANLVKTFQNLFLIMHFMACFWATASQMSVTTNMNWMSEAEITDEEAYVKYFFSLYWATVTALTIGYGDIVPENNFEVLFCIFSFIVGVSSFSYALSSFSNLIQELSKNDSIHDDRVQYIKEMQDEHSIPDRLINQVEFFFSKAENILNMPKDFDFYSWINELPINLKLQLQKFIYKEAINTIPFLQNRSDQFYIKYLQKFEPQRFLMGSNLLKERTKTEEIFLILSGDVLNFNTARKFSNGSIIGETDYVFKRDRKETFFALNTVYTLRLRTDILSRMLYDFPEIQEELRYIANEREGVLLMQGKENIFQIAAKNKILLTMEALIDKEISKQERKRKNSNPTARNSKKFRIKSQGLVNSKNRDGLIYEDVRSSRDGAMQLNRIEEVMQNIDRRLQSAGSNKPEVNQDEKFSYTRFARNKDNVIQVEVSNLEGNQTQLKKVVTDRTYLISNASNESSLKLNQIFTILHEAVSKLNHYRETFNTAVPKLSQNDDNLVNDVLMKTLLIAQKGISEYFSALTVVEQKLVEQETYIQTFISKEFVNEIKDLNSGLQQSEQTLEVLEKKVDQLLQRNEANNQLKEAEVLRKNLMRELAEEKKEIASKLMFKDLLQQRILTGDQQPQAASPANYQSLLQTSQHRQSVQKEDVLIASPIRLPRREENPLRAVATDDIAFGMEGTKFPRLGELHSYYNQTKRILQEMDMRGGGSTKRQGSSSGSRNYQDSRRNYLHPDDQINFQ